MWNGIGWYGFIGVITTSTTDISLVPRQYFFCGSFCYLCLVLSILLRLFIAALWSHEGKELTSWLLFVMFIVILLLSRLVSWYRYGT